MSLKNSIAVITGAAGGIGSATCQLFAEEGATVVAIDNRQAELDKLFESISQTNGKCHLSLVGDVSDSEIVEKFAKLVIEKYKQPPNIIVNCVVGFSPNGIIESDESTWDYVINNCLKNVFLINHHFVALMKEYKIKGSIINFSSTATDGLPYASAYCAAKAALEGLTKSMAKELAPLGIRVNAIKPGPINTPPLQALGKDFINVCISDTLLKRMGTPMEVAQLCLYLASEKSAFCTGSVYNITGGYRI